MITVLGDPHEDLAKATVLMMVGGKMVLLRPQKVTNTLSVRDFVTLIIML